MLIISPYTKVLPKKLIILILLITEIYTFVTFYYFSDFRNISSISMTVGALTKIIGNTLD